MNFETTQELKKEITALVENKKVDAAAKAILDADIWHYNYSVSKDELQAISTGYADACCGMYDKWWRYSSIREEFYHIGSRVAQELGFEIKRFIEVNNI